MFHKLRKAFFIFLWSILFSVVVGIVATDRIMHSMYLDKLQGVSSDISKVIPKIAEDLAVIDAADIFTEVTFSRNAEPFISKHIGWETNEERPPVLSKELLQKHKDWTKDETVYKSLLNDPDFESMNVDWVKQLKDFDHIDMSSNDRVAKQLKRIPVLGGIERVGVNSTLPLLNFSDFVNHATIYALKKRNGSEQDKREALSSLHHVAKLLLSTSSLVGQMTAVMALRRELFVSEKFGIKVTENLSHDVIDRMKRVGFAWPGVMYLAGIQKMPKEIEPYLKPEFLVCGAASEVPFPVMISEYLEPRWPLESNFQQELDSHRDLYQKLLKNCHANSQEVYLKTAETNESATRINTLLNIPYVRRTFASTTMQIAIPNYVGTYERMAEEKPQSK